MGESVNPLTDRSVRIERIPNNPAYVASVYREDGTLLRRIELGRYPTDEELKQIEEWLHEQC